MQHYLANWNSRRAINRNENPECCQAAEAIDFQLPFSTRSLGIMKRLLPLLWLTASAACVASPCDSVDQSLSSDRKAVLAPVVTKQVARQIDIQSVEVLESYYYKGWYILYVSPKTADEAFLFYNGDPVSHTYLLAWPDAFSENDQRRVMRTLSRGKTKGIPRPLAECFAWHVTKVEGQK